LKAIDLNAKALERRVKLAERLKKLPVDERDTIDAVTLAAKAVKADAALKKRGFGDPPVFMSVTTTKQVCVPGNVAQAVLKRSEAAKKAAATRKRNRELAVG